MYTQRLTDTMKKLHLTFAFFCCMCSSLAQTQIFGGNTYQTFSSAGTTSGSSSNAQYRLYAAVGQPMAASSSTLSQTQAGILSAVSNGLILVDNTPPIITAPTATLNKTGTKSIGATVTDNVAVSQVKVNYRTITSPISTLTNATMSSGANNTFTVAPASNWYDEMGIEYFFTATDSKGNSSRFPAADYLRTSLTTVNLILPQIPFGNVVANYRMVSFPYDQGSDANNSVSAVYSGINLDDTTKARMYNYNPATKKYLEFKTGGFAKVERGKSYWLQTKDQKAVTLASVTSPPEHRSNLFKITLKPGWNQVGNPYPVEIAWSNVLAFNSSVSTLGKLNVFNGSFAEADALPAFQGGFVKNTGAADVQITIPFKGQTALGGRVAQVESIGTDLSSDAWNLKMNIVQNEIENKLGGFGMHHQASIGPDRYDNYNPPRFLSAPEVNFSHSETSELFSNDMVPTKENGQWKFSAYGESGKSSVLQWSSDINTIDQELYLFDEKNLVLTNMLEKSSYPFTQQKDSRFTIYFGRQALKDIRPEEVGASSPYPNPVAAEKITRWMVAIPQGTPSALVGLQLFDGTGKVITADNKLLPPGLHEMKYTLTESQEAGMYYYRLAIGAGQNSKIYTGKIIVP